MLYASVKHFRDAALYITTRMLLLQSVSLPHMLDWILLTPGTITATSFLPTFVLQDARVVYTHPLLAAHDVGIPTDGVYDMTDRGVWDFADYQQLANCLDANSKELVGWTESNNLWEKAIGMASMTVDDKAAARAGMSAEEKALILDLIPFPLLIKHSPAELHARSLMLIRFSSLMMSVMPLLDLFSKEETNAEMGAIRQMRGLLLGDDKSQLITGLLDQCRRTRTGDEGPRGERGTWATVNVDRLGAIPGNSEFRQIFNELRDKKMVAHNDM